jgi:O-methyltransferase involved in polyketide biosynthesis
MTQVPTNDFDKIGLTAFGASLSRQFTNLPYARELAQWVESQGLVEYSLSQEQAKTFAAGTVYLEARYRAINQVMAQYSITQVLELASGLLPRGLFLSRDPNITFVESDLPPIIRCKQQLVQQLIGERSNLHFLEIDATSSTQFLQSGDCLKAGKPVVIICEGLLMYLSQIEKQRVCANIREMLSSYGGVWITSDLTFIAGLRQNDPAYLEQVKRGTAFTGRSLDHDFQTIEQARQFADEQGFHVAEHSVLDVMNQLSCLEILGIDTAMVRKMLTEQYVFAMTLDAA